MRDFIIWHLSGDYFADNHMTSFAAFATRYTEVEADRMVAADPAYRRKVRIQPVGSYSSLPLEVVDRFERLEFSAAGSLAPVVH